MTDFIWYFLMYSVLGFVVEVLFARVIHNPKRDRKCHYLLPVCPVYGLGAVLILLLPDFILSRPLLLLPCAIALCTAAEFVMGVFYEKVAGVSFWDYSQLPLNLDGKVCLIFSACWGALALVLVYAIHPLLAALVAAIPPVWALLAALLFAADALFSVYVLRKTHSTDVLRWYAH